MIADVPDLEPFYRPLDGPDGERFHATFSTTGPWFADAQHGGPPAALLIRAFERCAPRPGTALSRVTVEVLGRIPAGEVEVRARMERPGRSIELLGAEMLAGGRAVLRARAWRLAEGDTAEVVSGTEPALPPPDGVQVHPDRAEGWLPGYIDAVEWRWVSGGWDVPGPGELWGRPRVALVEGEEITPLQRLAVVGDSANGIGSPLDIRHWLYVNTELTVHLHRVPAGEWVGVRASSVIGPTGLGTATGLLFDTDGHVGRTTQGLTVRPRS
ncbi:thioesterase family protein [Pseudonocardia petroleophila]|uniref:Thioesterase family protein n=1 Tax=Pseudonocardia petroleophila TaxID=37331 RepID=A0A7G7MEB5_9PSEU|nr:thioesterase family protein [Pseudonocardia petroleophila]